jgi:hypothetical protein
MRMLPRMIWNWRMGTCKRMFLRVAGFAVQMWYHRVGALLCKSLWYHRVGALISVAAIVTRSDTCGRIEAHMMQVGGSW